MLEQLGVPRDWARMVRQMGAQPLVGELRRLKLARLLGGSKLNQLGMLYAQASVHLRIAQTSVLDDERSARS